MRSLTRMCTVFGKRIIIDAEGCGLRACRITCVHAVDHDAVKPIEEVATYGRKTTRYAPYSQHHSKKSR